MVSGHRPKVILSRETKKSGEVNIWYTLLTIITSYTKFYCSY